MSSVICIREVVIKIAFLLKSVFRTVIIREFKLAVVFDDVTLETFPHIIIAATNIFNHKRASFVSVAQRVGPWQGRADSVFDPFQTQRERAAQAC